MARLSPGVLYRATVALIWGLAAWHCWTARGLYLDGNSTLVVMMNNGGFALFHGPRLHLMALTQAPAAWALAAGVTDSHTLARLYSLGLFFAPTAFYHAALFRARRDPALLACVLFALAVVFLPTSFFIIGEYNTVCAAVLFAGLVLATGKQSMLGDGFLLVATSVLLLRSYETMAAFGPLLALLVAWRLAIAGRWNLASALQGIAAVLFLTSAGVSVLSLHDPWRPSQLGDTLHYIWDFWRNPQFMLPLLAVAVVALPGLAMPRLFAARYLYLAAGLLLVLVAASPLLLLADIDVGPFPRTHYHTRMAASAVLAADVVAVWLIALRPVWLPRLLGLLADPSLVRRLLVLQMAALLAGLPADLALTELWRRSLGEFQATISARSGLIAVEDTAFLRRPYSEMVEMWTLPCESVVLRRKTSDGLVLPPRGFSDWMPFDPRQPLPANLQKFRWGE